MRVAALVVPMACVLSDDEDSDNGAPPHRSGVSTAIASPCKLSMPSTLTSVARLVKDGELNEWIVRAGDDVSKFLYANGPGRIVRYNFIQVHTRVKRRFVERSCTSAGLDFSDIFALTGEGQRALSSLLGFEFQLACTGKSICRCTTRLRQTAGGSAAAAMAFANRLARARAVRGSQLRPPLQQPFRTLLSLSACPVLCASSHPLTPTQL